MAAPTQASPQAERETLYFARPSSQYRAHSDEIDAAIRRVLNGHVYIMGEEVKAFEAEFAAYCGADHAVGVANGTDALHLAMRAYDIGPGDEVITTAHTAVATIAAIEMAGATPRFVDITLDRYGLDPVAVEAAIGPKTRAIVAVHIYGHPVDMAPLLDLKRKHGLVLIEDCAQATGAKWQGQRVGTIGDIGCFSLYPTKNLGAIGDGGIIVTSDSAAAEKLRLLRQYGWRDRQLSEIAGWNSRLDEIQAAILRAKLPHLDAWNERRRQIASRYSAAFTDLPIFTPWIGEDCEPVFHLYVLRSRERDRMKAALAEHGIVAGIHYPIPAHRHPAYAERFQASLPRTEACAGEILSLPMYPELTDEQVGRVIDGVRAFHRMAAAD